MAPEKPKSLSRSRSKSKGGIQLNKTTHSQSANKHKSLKAYHFSNSIYHG